MIKAEMVYTLDDMKKFCRSSMNARITRYTGIFVAAAITACAVIVIRGMNHGMKLSDISGSSITLLAVGLLVYAYLMVFYHIMLPTKNFNTVRKSSGKNPVKFEFDENGFNLQAKNGKNYENIRIEFDNLYGITEVRDYFFIYFTKEQAYILRKSAINEGTPKQLSRLLAKKLGDRYVKRYRK